MREISFRAWDTEGDMYYLNIQNHICDEVFAFGNMIKNDRFIIEQYTGISDKNGKMIFEGDIVKYGNDKPQVVIFKDCCFCFYLKANKHVARLQIFGKTNKYEVISNIHTEINHGG